SARRRCGPSQRVFATGSSRSRLRQQRRRCIPAGSDERPVAQGVARPPELLQRTSRVHRVAAIATTPVVCPPGASQSWCVLVKTSREYLLDAMDLRRDIARRDAGNLADGRRIHPFEIKKG